MQASINLPQPRETRNFLSDLLGVDVKVEDCSDKLDPPSVLADYTDANNETRHFIACDNAGAAILGAALTVMPVGVTQEAIQSGELSETLLGNLEEVLNVAVNLFPQSSSHRIVIDKLYTGEEATAEYEKCSEIPQMHIAFTLPRYGSGKITIGAS